MRRALCASFAFFAISLALCEKPQDRADEILLGLSDIERVAQVFLISVAGDSTFTPLEFQEDGRAALPGGFILFSYNVSGDASQLKGYIESAKQSYAANASLAPYVAVDQEGGLVNRLRGVTSPLPSQKEVAGSLTPAQAQALYSSQAKELYSLGIALNLAPVAEAELASNRLFLTTRTFGDLPASCVYSIVCVRAYEENGVGTVAKHFPGNANADPHTGAVEITASRDEVFSHFVLPFAFTLAASPSAVLMSHAKVVQLDSSPACTSRFWIEDVLRGMLGFEGLVISDDIFMKALSDSSPEQTALDAISSGVDVIMYSEKRFLSIARFLLDEAARDPVFAGRLFDAERKVVSFKLAKGIIE